MKKEPAEILKKYAHALRDAKDLDVLMERIGDANVVMLGEASHGTHEYYTWRAQISKRLIEEKGFTLITVEGDWPDCAEINKWIKGLSPIENIHDVLKNFTRWPTWMWGNWEIAAFASWLKDYNQNKASDEKVGFYGMDVYSLWDSLKIIVDYLEKEDPESAKLAQNAWKCFEPYKERDNYASVFRSEKKGCKDEVLRLLNEVRTNAYSYNTQPEAGLNTEINALVVANAENYYKTMALFSDESWNVRDRHMMETLDTLKKYHGYTSKIIIWAHNTHIGDARATDMGAHGLLNIGQLARQLYGKNDVVLVGFGSHSGSVVAGDHWGAPMRNMEVPSAISGSFENTLHTAIGGNALFIVNENEELRNILSEKMGHRAIGVVYDPARERGNYVPSNIAERYDAFLFIDQTNALHPINNNVEYSEKPDTFPFGE